MLFPLVWLKFGMLFDLIIFLHMQIRFTDLYVCWFRARISHARLSHAQSHSSFHLCTCRYFQVLFSLILVLTKCQNLPLLLTNKVPGGNICTNPIMGQPVSPPAKAWNYWRWKPLDSVINNRVMINKLVPVGFFGCLKALDCTQHKHKSPSGNTSCFSRCYLLYYLC